MSWIWMKIVSNPIDRDVRQIFVQYKRKDIMKEIRNYKESEIRAVAPETRKVEGYAVVFDSLSNDLGGFTEIINRNALDGVLEKSDVFCLLNHDNSRGVLARSNKGTGSLELSIDDKGLKYRFEAPKTALGDELLEGLRRGDISASSFAFTVGSDSWEKREDGSYLRTINSIKELFDVSPVYQPAYSATSVDTRGLDQLKTQEQKELDEYYKELEKKLM